MRQDHYIQKAKAKNERYRNRNPKNRIEQIKFFFKRWWQLDSKSEDKRTKSGDLRSG